jgi:hypothetical protein
VQNRAANDPEFAAALLREAADTPPLTMRDALRQIRKAASYPRPGKLAAGTAMSPLAPSERH